MITKLRKKIAAINLILASIILFSALIVVSTIGYRHMLRTNDLLIDGALNETRRISPVEYKMRQEFENVTVFRFEIDGGVTIFSHGNSNRNLTELKQVAQHIVDTRQGDGIYFFEYVRFSVKEFDDGVVCVALMDVFTNNSVGKYILMAFVTLLVGLGCFFVISLMLANLSLKPVEESWLQQKQFVADASHELKTPLSVIMANVDIIASHADQPVSSQMKWLENTRTESQKMAELVNSLLFLAKHDDGLVVQKDEVNFSDCAGNMSLSYDAKIYENSKTFSHEIDLDVFVYGNKQQLLQLVTILLDNANKYSVGSGNILLTLKNHGKFAELTVSNDSVTLSEEQLKHVFDRFFTVEQSRNKNSGGNGLGLSIAKVIVETHGGKISVSSQNNRTSFVALLPVSKQKH